MPWRSFYHTSHTGPGSQIWRYLGEQSYFLQLRNYPPLTAIERGVTDCMTSETWHSTTTSAHGTLFRATIIFSKHHADSSPNTVRQGQTFVIIVIELYHGGVGAGAQTFYFEECKEPILGGLARFNSQMRFNGALNVFGSANHAGCGAAELNKILSHLCSIEHGVEGGDFVDSCWSHVDNVSNLVHGGDGQPTAMLALGQVEERDNAGLFVIGGVCS